MLTPNKAEKILLESHKKGGRVGDKQKRCHKDDGGTVKKASGGGMASSMGANVPAGTFAEKYKKGGSAKMKRSTGGSLKSAIEKIW